MAIDFYGGGLTLEPARLVEKIAATGGGLELDTLIMPTELELEEHANVDAARRAQTLGRMWSAFCVQITARRRTERRSKTWICSLLQRARLRLLDCALLSLRRDSPVS